jgi:hypothetical protein
LNLNGTFLPQSTKENQPSISQITFGIEYHINTLKEAQVQRHENNGCFFLKIRCKQVTILAKLDLVQIIFWDALKGR